MRSPAHFSPPSLRSRRPLGGRRAFRVLALAILVGIVALASTAQAQGGQSGSEAALTAIPSGTEVMLTDASGWRLIGYGMVEEDRLTLALSGEDESDASVVVFTPDGEITTLSARLASGAIVLWFDGSPFPFETWMAERGVTVTITSAGDGARDDEDRSDDDSDDERDDDERDDERDDDERDDDGGDDGAADDDAADDDAGESDARDDDAEDPSDDASDDRSDDDSADDPDDPDELDEPDEPDDD